MRHAPLISAIILCLTNGVNAQTTNQQQPANATPSSTETPTWSLAVTLNWLRDQMVTGAPRNFINQPTAFATCTIRFRRMAGTSMTSFTVPLADLDASNVTIEEQPQYQQVVVRVHTKAGKKSIAFDASSSKSNYDASISRAPGVPRQQSQGSSAMMDVIGMPFRTKEIAARVAAAFAHAIELCQNQ